LVASQICFGLKVLKFALRQEHDINVFADSHALGSLIGELCVERKAQPSKKVLGLLDVSHWEIDEDFLGHTLAFENCSHAGFRQYIERKRGRSTPTVKFIGSVVRRENSLPSVDGS
jgi:hypothetical protein